jgi:mono/diheme cytochrome c family protein
MRFLLALIIASALAAQTPEAHSKSNTAPSGDARHGRQIFQNYGCYQCHGRQAQGGLGTGAPRLGPKPIAFVAFERYIRHPAGQMPPYTTKVVSNQDLADIYAFLEGLPQPPPVKDIPLLNE